MKGFIIKNYYYYSSFLDKIIAENIPNSNTNPKIINNTA